MTHKETFIMAIEAVIPKLMEKYTLDANSRSLWLATHHAMERIEGKSIQDECFEGIKWLKNLPPANLDAAKFGMLVGMTHMYWAMTKPDEFKAFMQIMNEEIVKFCEEQVTLPQVPTGEPAIPVETEAAQALKKFRDKMTPEARKFLEDVASGNLTEAMKNDKDGH